MPTTRRPASYLATYVGPRPLQIGSTQMPHTVQPGDTVKVLLMTDDGTQFALTSRGRCGYAPVDHVAPLVP